MSRPTLVDRFMAETISFGGLPCLRRDALAVARDTLEYTAREVDWFVMRPAAVQAAPLPLTELRGIVGRI